MGAILSIIGSALSSVITTLLQWFGIYRAGEAAQANKDDKASLADATQARKIDDADSALSDSQLDDRLRGPGPNG